MKPNNLKSKISLLFRIFFYFLSGSLLTGLLVLICIVCHLFLYAHTPAGNHIPSILKIFKGESFHQVANNLDKKQFILYPRAFSFLAIFMKADRQIKSGHYLLSPAMTPLYILSKLKSGNVQLTKVVIPEGYTIELIAKELDAANIVSQQSFLQYANDPLIARSLGIEADSLEGYLFPDTYYFAQHTRPSVVVETMLKQFWSLVDEAFYKRAEELGFSIHEIVTFASIIEKETGQAFERPIIASVFHNRLKRNMRLESDPTVIYGIENFDGNLTRKHLKDITPYNTYRIKGLPHGPIANPGEQSIKAVLYPASSKYLYFVAKKDGTHHFSTNLKSHNKAVNLYQRKKRKKRNNSS
jgi:UPF0755 protein